MKAPPLFRARGPYGIPLPDLSLRSAIQRHIAMVVDYTDGNLSWAAQELGINGGTLWRWRNGKTSRASSKCGTRRPALARIEPAVPLTEEASA